MVRHETTAASVGVARRVVNEMMIWKTVVNLTSLVYHHHVGVVTLITSFVQTLHYAVKTTTPRQPYFSPRASMPNNPALLAVAAKLLQRAAQDEDVVDLLQDAFPAIAEVLGADYVALAGANAGHWSVAAEWGFARRPKGDGMSEPLPLDLLAEVLDREMPRAAMNWLAAPLAPSKRGQRNSGPPSTLTAPAPLPKGEGSVVYAVERLASVLHQALSAVRSRAADRPTAPPPGGRAGNRRPVEPDPRGRAAVEPDGRGGHTALGGGSGEHLSLGSAESYAGRPAGTGRRRRRTAHPRRPRRGGRSHPHAASPAGSTPRRSPRPSIATSMPNSAITPARCCAFRFAAARASCSAHSS